MNADMDDQAAFGQIGRRQVQDDLREIELANLLRLQRNERRTGSDARDERDHRYELKTVTTENVVNQPWVEGHRKQILGRVFSR